MRGNITRRGRSSWRLKVELPRLPGEKRRFQLATVRGKRQAAEAKLTEMLAAIDRGTFVAPSKITVAEHVRARVAQWKAAGDIGEKTAERYGELIENQIVPHIGALQVQRLKTADIENWHTALRTGGRKDGGALSARTIKHAHRILAKALRDAVKFDLAVRNVAGRDGERAPKVAKQEVEVIAKDRIGTLLAKLDGRAIRPKAITTLFTGLRRGELLALRWPRIDLERKTLGVREALEETKAHGVRFKPAKTEAGRRDIELPDIVVETLRDHRRVQLERRMALGLGKLDDDALVFPALDGGPQSPRQLSGDWREFALANGFSDVTFHALRHTHVSMLIAQGVDIVRISKRIGHANPKITLEIYSHLFEEVDTKSAAAINTLVTTLIR